MRKCKSHLSNQLISNTEFNKNKHLHLKNIKNKITPNKETMKHSQQSIYNKSLAKQSLFQQKKRASRFIPHRQKANYSEDLKL